LIESDVIQFVHADRKTLVSATYAIAFTSGFSMLAGTLLWWMNRESNRFPRL
jgi:hypothetical protein